MAVHMFRWNGLSAVDSKGRLSVPAAYRQTIEARGGGKEILVSKHQKDPCITCYDRGHEERIAAMLDEQRVIELGRGDNDSHFRRSRGAFGTATIVQWDTSGRIVLPPFLKDRAGIDSLALFVAFGDGFEIWDPQRALDQPDEELRELAAFYLREKEAGA